MTDQDTVPPADSAAPTPSTLTMLLVAATIFGIAGLLVFSPCSGTSSSHNATPEVAPLETSPSSSPTAEDPRGRAAVRPRDMDQPRRAPRPVASTPWQSAPAIQLGTAPPRPKTPPSFETVEDEIAWLEKELALAQADRKARAEFIDRYQRRRDRLRATHADPEQLSAFEQRGETVQANYDRALAKVTALQARLQELRAH